MGWERPDLLQESPGPFGPEVSQKYPRECLWKTGVSQAECTKIAHRCSLAIFITDEVIAGNSAARIILPVCIAEKIAVR